jgi:hypothetical protein
MDRFQGTEDRTELEKRHSRDPDREEDAPRAPSTSEPHPEDFDDVTPVKGDEDVR